MAAPTALNLTRDYRMTATAPPRKIHRGLDEVVHRWIGAARRRSSVAEKLRVEAEQTHELSLTLRELGEDALEGKLRALRANFGRREKVATPLLRDALATVAEAAARQLGLRPYPVQLMAALATHRGYLVEMATGEGKTLTVSLSAVLAGWSGLPCHVITSNDYLAARDAEWLAPFYARCGLTSGCVTASMRPPQRRENYARDITYTTAKDACADFLRDRLQLGKMVNPTRRLVHGMKPGDAGQLVMRGLGTAIVDEADSALVDEAVTPLLISRPQDNEDLRAACSAAARLAAQLVPGEDYAVDPRHEEVVLNQTGLARLTAQADGLPAMFRGVHRCAELVSQALRAREFFHRGHQYVVEEGKVVIVDEATGRLMHQRTWREGLHQAVEAQEGLEVTTPSETLARLSFQRFFRLYPRLCGLSGTVWESRKEAWTIYELPTLRVPTHRPSRRIDLPDAIFATGAEKWNAVVEEIAARHAQGQPVLVGTRSVAISEDLAARLDARGLPFALLNAVKHLEEAGIIAEAGRAGRITIATNMAGRGTDIRLGPGVVELGGLHVILTERHGSRRVDRQLMGRAARQGDPGSSQCFSSLDDELPRRRLAAVVRERLQSGLQNGLPGVALVSKRWIDRLQAQAESQAARQRRELMNTDTWIDDSLAFAGADVSR